MVSLRIDPDAVAAAGSQVAAAGSHSTRLPAAAGPAAADPVSVAIAVTLAARAGAVSANSALGSAVAAHHGGRLSADAASYVEVDDASAATLGGVGGAGPLPGAGSLPPLSDFTVPPVPAPAVAGIPGDGKAIAELLHAKTSTTGLSDTAAWLRGHADELRSASTALHSAANDVEDHWSSDAAGHACARIRELSTWYGGHAEHASAAASAIDRHLDSYARAKSAVPSPEEFDDNERRLRMAVAANSAPGSLGRYTPVINQLVAERAGLNAKAVQGYGEYAATAGPDVAGDPQSPPPHPHGGVQKLSGDLPLSPQPQDPPHGKDPRYWLDLDKVIHVGPGQLAPYGTKQIGPGLYYPDPGLPVGGVPGAAKHPLDVADMVTTAPKGLGPNGYEQLSPGRWAPSIKGLDAAQPWPTPQQPVDIRDVIQVPAGQLAPSGYIEYLPGFWAPDVTYPRAR